MSESHSIEVIGAGAGSAVPDAVTLQIGLQATATSVATALSALTEHTSAVQAAVRELPQVQTSQTAGLGIQPEYDHSQGGKTGSFTASHRLTVQVRGVEQAGALVSAVVAAGGDAVTIDSLTLSVTDPSDAMATAREAAFADASLKAEHYARLAGRTLGEALRIADAPAPGGGGGGPMMRLASSDAFASTMEVEAGEHTVTATVVVTFALS